MLFPDVEGALGSMFVFEVRVTSFCRNAKRTCLLKAVSLTLCQSLKARSRVPGGSFESLHDEIWNM